jgi:hypothetical protein
VRSVRERRWRGVSVPASSPTSLQIVVLGPCSSYYFLKHEKEGILFNRLTIMIIVVDEALWSESASQEEADYWSLKIY